MFSHSEVWSAIDNLADRHAMSVSRLARSAGLDPTTFNKSKRESADGRLRWPSTESLAKIMAATETPVEQFTALIGGATGAFTTPSAEIASAGFAESTAAYRAPPTVPLLGMAQAGNGGFFDDAGFPAGEGWDAVEMPGADDGNRYALEISGDSMLPLYRDGDRIIVDPTTTARRGDRVVVRTTDGEVLAKELARKTARRIELKSLNPAHEDRSFDLAEIDWMARIMWASQ